MRIHPALPQLRLPLLGCGSTSTDEEGLSVAVSLAAPSSPALQDGVRVIENDLGYRVRLESGFLATGSVELQPCEHDHHGALDWRQLGRGLRDLVIARAWAHSMGSPVKLGIPAVESLLAAPGASVKIGAMEPPPGEYCGLLVSIFAADDDAVGLPADGSMVGKTLRLRGSFQREGAAEPTSFEIDSDLPFDAVLPISRLELSLDGERSAALAIGKALDHCFDGVDFEDDDDETIATAFLANLQASLEVASR